MIIEIELFRCLETNIGILIRDGETGEVASIDAPDAGAIQAALVRKNWPLDHVFITHSHSDHIQGLDALRKVSDFRVVAPEKSRELIQKADLWVGEGDIVRIGNLHLSVLATPGHCQDHVSYWIEEEAIMFVGDVLFTMGCGRVFGGDYKGMWGSLQRLSRLPDATRFYCGHDYALSNARFATQVEPENKDIIERLHVVEEKKKSGQFIMPTTMAEEKKTNPFLRLLQEKSTSSTEKFKTLRDWKDRF